MAGPQCKEEDIFISHYSSLCNTLRDVNNLLPYFVQENIVNTSDVEEINAIAATSKKVEKLLQMISGPLRAGDAKGFHIMLTIMREHGTQSTKDLAARINHEVMSCNSIMKHKAIDRHHDCTTVKTADPLSAQFSTFVAIIEALLQQCHDKLELSKQFCSNLTISDNSDELLFSDQQLQKINACTTFNELFTILRKHWSWRDHSILTHIISITDLKEAKDELKLFKTRMASYEGMKIISENIPPEAISYDYIILSVIIDKPYRELTLEDFTKLRDFIFRNLDIKHYIALPHIKFLFSSLHLEWYVVKKAASHMIKMGQQNEKIFIESSVVFIQIDQSVVLDCRAKMVDDKKQAEGGDDSKLASSSWSGGYNYIFVDAPPDRLICTVCHLPCRKVQLSGCCGHVFCKYHIDQLKSVQPVCPLCRAEEFATVPNRACDREIQQLKVYCPNKDTTGCKWIGEIKDIDRHYSYGKECKTEFEKWTGKDGNFVDQLIDLGFKRYLDIEMEYEVSVGKGGPACGFFHHYIVLESSELPVDSNRLIFELAKTCDATGRRKVTPTVRVFSCDGNPDYKITITTTLRWLAELASKVMHLLRPYNLITASSQTFSDEFLKELGSSGYMTYVKTSTTTAAVSGVIGAAAGLLYWLSSDKKEDRTQDRR